MGVVIDHTRAIAIEAGASILEVAISPVTQSSIAARRGVNSFVFYGFGQFAALTGRRPNLWLLVSLRPFVDTKRTRRYVTFALTGRANLGCSAAD